MGSNQANLILSINSGQRSGEQIPISPGEVRTIGRTIAADIAVGDNFMSGVHFEIENYGDFAELRDRKSTNKTWVNHSSQMKCRITPGDIILAGKTVFSILWESLPQVDVSPISLGSLDKICEDDDRGHNSISPIGSSYAVFQDEANHQPADAEVVVVAETGNYLQSSRSSSPFESLDASYLAKFENRVDEPAFIPQTQDFSPRKFGSPFDESSIVKSPFIEAPVFPVVVPTVSKPTVIRVLKSRSSTTDTDIWSMIQVLSKQCDLRVVSHFRKIGQLTPSNLRLLPVFPFIADAREHLPVIVEANEWLRMEDKQVTDRLAQADGLVLVLTKGTSAVESQVQELSHSSVAGFSEGNGFLGWCWPSQLQAILSSLSEPARVQFFGETIDGFLFPTTSKWIAYANSDLVPTLAKFGFA